MTRVTHDYHNFTTQSSGKLYIQHYANLWQNDERNLTVFSLQSVNKLS